MKNPRSGGDGREIDRELNPKVQARQLVHHFCFRLSQCWRLLIFHLKQSSCYQSFSPLSVCYGLSDSSLSLSKRWSKQK